MENLEQRCVQKLNKILSKFNLKIEIFYNESLNVWQYRLVDNFLPTNSYADWLYSWSSILDMLMCDNSIFDCLNTYSAYEFNSHLYNRYSEAFNAIKHLENISSLEEFLINCDLIGI